MSVTARWSLRGLGLVVVALALQILLAHQLALVGVGINGRSWVTSAIERHVAVLLHAELGHARGRAEGLLESPALHDALARGDRAAVFEQLAPLGRVSSWWLLETAANGRDTRLVSTMRPDCAAEAQRIVADPSTAVIVCAHDALAIEWLGTDARPGLKLGVAVPLGDAFVERAHHMTSADVMLVIDGVAVNTSLRHEDGSALVLPELLDEDAPAFAAVTTRIDGFAGYVEYETQERVFGGTGELRWFRAYGPLGGSDRVRVVLAVPEPLLGLGAHYSLIASILGAFVIVVLLGIAIRQLVRRFRLPIDGLVASAKRVTAGDFSGHVTAPPNHELAMFCATYNDMLGRVEAQLRLRSELAREAGIAEMAVGVLHNVGNALNSVTAAVGLAGERLDALPVARLERLADLLAKPDLPDDTRQHVPALVTELARELRASQERVAHELVTIQTAADHACDVVAAQQRHARRIDMVERCEIATIVDDTLRIAHLPPMIAVTRTCDEVLLPVDRHRVVQILVNLVTS